MQKVSTFHSALISAARYGDTYLVKLLLDGGAEADAQTSGGDTALMWTIRNGHTGVARLLLSSGASIYVQNRYGETAQDIAFYDSHEEMLALLRSVGGYAEQPAILYDASSSALDADWSA